MSFINILKDNRFFYFKEQHKSNKENVILKQVYIYIGLYTVTIVLCFHPVLLRILIYVLSSSFSSIKTQKIL